MIHPFHFSINFFFLRYYVKSMSKEESSPNVNWWSTNQGWVYLGLAVTLLFSVLYYANKESNRLGSRQNARMAQQVKKSLKKKNRYYSS